MTSVRQVYRCNVCGNIVMVLHAGVGRLVCCGQPMQLLEEKAEDVGREKHVPVIEKAGNATVVKVGSVPHPMQSEHYIEWIELTAGNTSFIAFLRPGEEPKAVFPGVEGEVAARAYCNVHGLWGSKASN